MVFNGSDKGCVFNQHFWLYEYMTIKVDQRSLITFDGKQLFDGSEYLKNIFEKQMCGIYRITLHFCGVVFF